MARPTNESKKQLEALASFTEEQLREVAGFMGVKPSDITEETTREQILELIAKAKNKQAEVAVPAVIGPDGKKMDCPVGYAIISVAPKSGNEFGKKSRETFFLSVQGVPLVGQRGKKLLIKEKFLSALQLATKTEYEQSEEDFGSAASNTRAVFNERIVYEETFQVHAHNPDLAALAAAEEDLIRGSEEYQKAKKLEKLSKIAFANHLL